MRNLEEEGAMQMRCAVGQGGQNYLKYRQYLTVQQGSKAALADLSVHEREAVGW